MFRDENSERHFSQKKTIQQVMKLGARARVEFSGLRKETSLVTFEMMGQQGFILCNPSVHAVSSCRIVWMHRVAAAVA